MNHTILYKRKGFYGAFPVLTHLPDGRLTVGIPVAPFHDHYAVGDWLVLLSEDEGETWQQTADPALPDNWPGTSPREIYDRFAAVMPDGDVSLCWYGGLEGLSSRATGGGKSTGASCASAPARQKRNYGR